MADEGNVVDTLAAYESLAPVIAARADAVEQTRQLPADVLDELHALGTFRLLVPGAFGGRELDLPRFLQVVDILARADASTAWCVVQGAIIGLTTCWLAPEVAREIWRAPDRVVANGPPGDGQLTRVDGGYRVAGRWSFSSGCRHATLFNASGRCDNDGRYRAAFLTPDQVQLIDDWHVAGLKGTGSFCFEVRDVVVADDYIADLAGPPATPAAVLRIPIALTFACGFATLALGLARRLLSGAEALARGKVPRFQSHAVKDDPDAQRMAGEAEARLQAACLLLQHAVADAWQAVSDRPGMDPEHRVRLRLAGTHGIREAEAVADLAYDICGATAIYADHPLQRGFQDLNVITQHVQGRRSFYRSVGGFFLGRPFEPGPME